MELVLVKLSEGREELDSIYRRRNGIDNEKKKFHVTSIRDLYMALY